MKLLLVLILTSTICGAHNNLFFPGDCYFSSALTQQGAAKLKTESEVSLSYTRYSKMFMSCGYAGVRNASIIKTPATTLSNLQKTLLDLFTNEADKARILKHTDKHEKYFPLFIYNKDFDFTTYPVALKFNEHFATEQTEKAKRSHVIDDRVDSLALKSIDDTHAKKVSPLVVEEIPADLTAFMGVKEPIIIDGSKIVFVILLGGSSPDLKGHAEKKTGLEILIVGETVRRITYP